MKKLVNTAIFMLLCVFTFDAAAQNIEGTWKIVDLQGSIELKTLPVNIIKKVKKSMVNNSFEYHSNGTYSGKGFEDNTGGKYKIQNGDIYHYDFAGHLSLKGKLNVRGGDMTITIKREDFLNTLSQTFNGKMSEAQLDSMYTISDEIVYVLKKI